MITLDENYSISPDTYNWQLNFAKDKEVTKKDKDGVEEQKIITERSTWYYPNIELALKKYTDESLKECENLSEVLTKLDEVHATLKGLNKVK